MGSRLGKLVHGKEVNALVLRWHTFLSNPSVLTLPLSFCFRVLLWKLKASQTSLQSVVFGANAIGQTWIRIGNIHRYLSNPTSLRIPVGPVDILHFFVVLTVFWSAFCHNVAKHCFLQNLISVCYGTAKLWQLVHNEFRDLSLLTLPSYPFALVVFRLCSLLPACLWITTSFLWLWRSRYIKQTPNDTEHGVPAQ